MSKESFWVVGDGIDLKLESSQQTILVTKLLAQFEQHLDELFYTPAYIWATGPSSPPRLSWIIVKNTSICIDAAWTFMGSLIRRGGFDSAFFQPMTRGCEWLTVGGQSVADRTAQKTDEKSFW